MSRLKKKNKEKDSASAFLHLFYEGDRVTRILSFNASNPIGSAGVDYPANIEVKSVALYKKNALQRRLDRYRHALRIISYPDHWDANGIWKLDMKPNEIALGALEEEETK